MSESSVKYPLIFKENLNHPTSEADCWEKAMEIKEQSEKYKWIKRKKKSVREEQQRQEAELRQDKPLYLTH